MENEETLFFFQQFLFWVNDNVGSGDGTTFIREIWKDDKRLAEHLIDKWKTCIKKAISVTHEDPDSTNWPTQQLALQDFLMSLSPNNLEKFIDYIIKNGRASRAYNFGR